MTVNGNELSKRLENDRAARRARAHAAPAAMRGRCVKCETTVWEDAPFDDGAEVRNGKLYHRSCAPKLPMPRQKKYSERAVRRLLREIEVGVSDVLRDMPEVPESDAAHDVAWNILYCAWDEHPDTVREAARIFGIPYSMVRRGR